MQFRPCRHPRHSATDIPNYQRCLGPRWRLVQVEVAAVCKPAEMLCLCYHQLSLDESEPVFDLVSTLVVFLRHDVLK